MNKKSIRKGPDKKPMLWEIRYTSSYRDDGEIIPVDERIYVLAESYAEALNVAEPSLRKCYERWEGGEVWTNVVALENLVPARCVKPGSWETQKVTLLPHGHYHLGVCLIPVERGEK